MLLDTSSLLGQSLKNMSDLNLFKNHLIHCYPECFETQLDNEDVQDLVEKMLESFGTEGALKITLNFLDIRSKTAFQTKDQRGLQPPSLILLQPPFIEITSNE